MAVAYWTAHAPQNFFPVNNMGDTPILYCFLFLYMAVVGAGAWALDESNRPIYPTVPGGEVQREMAFRAGVNLVMYALTGNYKADQVHVPALLERLGQ